MNEVLTVIFAGATGAAAVKLVDNVIQWALARKDKKENSEEITLKQLSDRIEVIEEGQRTILHDRIKYLAKQYTHAGTPIDYEDYKDLVAMHEVYHRLGGENLVRPMEDVSKLEMVYK